MVTGINGWQMKASPKFLVEPHTRFIWNMASGAGSICSSIYISLQNLVSSMELFSGHWTKQLGRQCLGSHSPSLSVISCSCRVLLDRDPMVGPRLTMQGHLCKVHSGSAMVRMPSNWTNSSWAFVKKHCFCVLSILFQNLTDSRIIMPGSQRNQPNQVQKWPKAQDKPEYSETGTPEKDKIFLFLKTFGTIIVPEGVKEFLPSTGRLSWNQLHPSQRKMSNLGSHATGQNNTAPPCPLAEGTSTEISQTAFPCGMRTHHWLVANSKDAWGKCS